MPDNQYGPTPIHDNSNMLTRAWNKAKELFGYKPEPITVARNISTMGKVAGADPVLKNEVGHEKNNVGTQPYHSAQHKAYERHMEKFAHKSEGKYDSAISHTGAVREATTGRMFSRVNSEEKMAKGYDDVDKKLLHKSIREGGMSKEYRQAIKPTAQSM